MVVLKSFVALAVFIALVRSSDELERLTTSLTETKKALYKTVNENHQLEDKIDQEEETSLQNEVRIEQLEEELKRC